MADELKVLRQQVQRLSLRLDEECDKRRNLENKIKSLEMRWTTCNPTPSFGFGFALKWVHSWFANFFKLIFNLSPFLDYLDHLMTIYWLVNLSQFTQNCIWPQTEKRILLLLSLLPFTTHKFKLSLLICSKKKNHVLKIMCPYLFMKNRLAENWFKSLDPI